MSASTCLTHVAPAASTTRSGSLRGQRGSSVVVAELAISVTEPYADVLVVTIAGDLEIASADELLQRFAELRAAKVVVDISGISFIDSSGLNALVAGARAVEANNGSMVVAGPPQYVARVFDLVRIADSVEVVASLEEALAEAETDAAGKRARRQG